MAVPIDYVLQRWPALTRLLDDGRVWLTNNAAERALCSLALGRRAWLFADSDQGSHRAAFFYSLITTAKLNDVDPLAWLTTYWRASPAIQPIASTSSCPGTGGRAPRPPRQPSPSDPYRGPHRMGSVDQLTVRRKRKWLSLWWMGCSQVGFRSSVRSCPGSWLPVTTFLSLLSIALEADGRCSCSLAA